MANLATINDNILADSGIDPINLIVGTGTINYIPKFTAEGSIGNSIMTESGANILISSNIVLHAGNYNNYAPTLTGGGASGTWGINISGNAATATNANNADTVDGLHASAFALAGGSNAIGTWPISITGSASSATAASTANLVIGTSGGAIQSWDIRTIAPSNMTAGRLGFGFTSWANNNSAPYADYLHLRSYTDASGGNDNLVMFLKSGIGMRIYQQAWGSSAPYTTYVDVLDSGNFNTWVPTKTGGGASGTWGISITGNADTLDGYHASDFALASALANYVPTSRTLTINGVTYDLSANRSWTIASGGVNSIIAGTGISVDQPQGDVRISNTGVLSINGSTGDITGVLTTSNYSSTLDNRYLFGTTNPGTPGNFNLSIGYNGSYSYVQSHSAQPLYLNPVGNSVFIGSYAAVYNSGTWGISITGNAATVGGYAVSGLWKLNEWNGNLYAHTDGRIYGTIFYDANDDAYFLNPNSSSNLYAVVARSYQGNGNIDGTGSASYHPSGFYSTATSWLYGTLYMNGNNMRAIGGIVQNDIMGRPNVQWGAGGSTTGAVIIKFPGGTGNYGMVHAVIDIYEYNGNNVSTVIVGGHNWGSQWYSYGANVVGYTNKQVRVGVKDGKYCIIIGDGSSTWSYGQVVLRKIQNGSYYSGVMDVGAGYTIGIESDSYSWVSGDLRTFRSSGSMYMNEQLVATQAWVSSQGYVTGGPFLPLSGGTVTGTTNFTSSVNMQATSWFGGYGPGYGAGIALENIGSFARFAFWGLDFYDWNHGIQMTIDNGYVSAANSFRAPIFYDSNDTSYYLDPNSGSNLYSIVTVETKARKNQSDNNYTTAALWTESYGGTTTGIAFHISGVLGKFLEMRTNGVLYWANDQVVTNNGGTWGINISGNAATASNASLLGGRNSSQYQWRSTSTIDMSGLDQNLYYPVTVGVTTNPVTRLRITNALNSNVPSWSNHPSGFSLMLDYTVNGSGWGTIEVVRNIQNYSERFGNVQICGGLTQMGNSSQEVIWLRGGGVYYFQADADATPTIRTSYYEIYGQSVQPTASVVNTVWNSISGSFSTYNLYAAILRDTNNASYYLDMDGSSVLYSVTTNGRVYSNEWIQFNNYTGLYSPNNGAHLRPNSGSYGPWLVTGTRNGWSGIEFESLNNGNVTMMINVSSNQSGWHNNSYGWQMKWEGGTAYVYKNTYGGGTQATVLDSSNAPYAWNMNQYVRTSDSVSFSGLTVTSNKILLNSDSGGYGQLQINSSNTDTEATAVWASGGAGQNSGQYTYQGVIGLGAWGLSKSNFYFGAGQAGPSMYIPNGERNVYAINSFRAPIFYDSNDTTYYLDPNGGSYLRGLVHVVGGHGNTQFRLSLPAAENGAAQGQVSLQMWCSEPGVTWSWAGFGYNVTNDGGSPGGFGRINGSFGQAYMRFSTEGDLLFYNTNTSGTRKLTSQFGNDGTATFYYAVYAPAYYESSDARLKTIVDENYRVDAIVSIKPKFYQKNGKFEAGYIAQEVEGVYAHAVTLGSDGYLGLSYSQVHTLKIAALEDSVDDIKKKIKELEEKLNTLY